MTIQRVDVLSLWYDGNVPDSEEHDKKDSYKGSHTKYQASPVVKDNQVSITAKKHPSPTGKDYFQPFPIVLITD